MSYARALGIDPGFASVGWGVVELRPDGEALLGMGVIQTKKSDKKRNIRSTDDNFDRAKNIARDLRSLAQEYNVTFIAAESMSYPRSASAAGKMCMCWGIMSALSQWHGYPFVCSTPQEIKLRVAGKKTANKVEVEDAIYKRLAIEGVVEVPCKSKKEHAFDAVAAVLASLDGEVAQMARRIGGPA